jgi:hypothetical protein
VFLVKERGKSKRKKFKGGQEYTAWHDHVPTLSKEEDLEEEFTEH